MHLQPGGGGQKVRPLPHAFHGQRAGFLNGLGRQPLASAVTARLDDLLAAFSGHARAETVTALAHQLARLIGPLHDTKLR